jgi:uncharacterized membrane protein (TIGR02234 family)
MSAPRRELGTAVAGTALAGGLALISGGQGWADVTVDRTAPLPPVSAVLTGAEAAPLVPAAGLVLLAAAVALLAVRGAGRGVVAVLVAAAGGVLVWSGIRALAGGLGTAAADLPGAGAAGESGVVVDLVAGWPVLALLAGLLGVAAGLLVVVRGRSWPGMGRRYERTGAAPDHRPAAARPQTDDDRAEAAWRALDRGEDPTVS